MRTSTASIALIRHEADGQTLWLAQWNAGWRAYNFVGGHKHENESFRDCMVRELAEELGLHDGKEILVPTVPCRRLEYTAISQRDHEQTNYAIELYDVALIDDRARSTINADPANRWLTEAEIHAERCDDGRPVSPTPKRFLLAHHSMPHYAPRPIDTTSIELSAAILELTEKLAENTHDNWAKLRLAQGWIYGEKRDDGLKQHPCLIPYADLPDSEKQHDRTAALETLKAILALGYRIEPDITEQIP